jgi:hypothetical protein
LEALRAAEKGIVSFNKATDRGHLPPFYDISYIVFGTKIKEHILGENYTRFGKNYH